MIHTPEGTPQPLMKYTPEGTPKPLMKYNLEGTPRPLTKCTPRSNNASASLRNVLHYLGHSQPYDMRYEVCVCGFLVDVYSIHIGLLDLPILS